MHVVAGLGPRPRQCPPVCRPQGAACRPDARRCGATHGPATHAVAAELTLPRGREATADEKKRAAVIHAEALRAALAQPAAFPPPRSGRR